MTREARLQKLALLVGVTALSNPLAGSALAEAPALSEIVVTAQKREQRLQEVPISLAALPASVLEDNRIDTLSGVQTLVPNFQISQNISVPTIYIRGVGGGGRNAGFDTRVGLYIDGVYIGNSAETEAVVSNIERVEILRGPQGYLYGQNTVAGAVNLITTSPTGLTEGRLAGSYGNKDAVRLSAMLNTPLVEDKVLFRLSGDYQNRDGFIRNVTLNEYTDDLDNYSGRAQLRVLANDRTTIDLTLDYVEQLSHTVNGEARTDAFGSGPPAPPADQPFVADDDFPERNRFRNWGTAGTIRYDADAFSLTSITSLRESSRHEVVDNDHSALPIAVVDFSDDYEYKTQELRINSAGDGRATYLVGVYYSDQQADTDRTVTIVDLAPLLGLPVNSAVTSVASVDTRSYAAFAALDYELTDTVTINSGLRYTSTRREMLLNQRSDLQPFGFFDIVDLRKKRSESSIDPSLGVTVNASEDVMAYVKYSRGTKAGGFNADFLSADQLLAPIEFAKETVNSYEIGFKSTLAGGVVLNVAAFYGEYDDYQVNQFTEVPNSSPRRVIARITNAGGVEVYGPEVSLFLPLSQELDVKLDVAYLEAEYTSFPDGGGDGIDFSGNRLEFAPAFTGSLSANYQSSRPLLAGMRPFANVTYSYHGQQYSNSSNDEVFSQGGYGLLNLALGLMSMDDKWRISAFADNALDKLYDLGVSPDLLTTRFGRYGQPRTYGLELAYRF